MFGLKSLKKRVKWILLAVIFFGVAYAICYCRNYEPSMGVIQELDALPDYDYIADVESLMSQKKWAEAKVLCENIINADLPQAVQAKELLGKCDKESKKIWSIVYKSGKAFITGNPDSSIEELGGSFASDMLLYGDIRDLAKQGYYKITKRETDMVIVALSSIGIATEFIDFADWAPAILKAIKKVGAMSPKMADNIVAMSKKITQTRKLDVSSKNFFSNTKQLVDKSGFIRTKDMFKIMDSPADTAKVLKHVENAPELTHMAIKYEGKNGLELLEETSRLKAGNRVLKKAIQKGVKPAARIMKSYHKGTLPKLILSLGKLLFKKMSAGVFYAVVAILCGCGVFSAWLGFRPVSKEKITQ